MVLGSITKKQSTTTYDTPRQSALFHYLSYFVGQIWGTSHKIICSQAYFGLSTMACPPISSWYVNIATSLLWHLAEQGFDTWHRSTIMWKISWGLSHWQTQDKPNHIKTRYDDIKEAYLAKECNSFHLLGKKLDCLHLKDFFWNMNMNCTWSNHWLHDIRSSLYIASWTIKTIKLTLASISQRIQHSATLENQLVWNHLDVLSIPLAFSTSQTSKSSSFH